MNGLFSVIRDADRHLLRRIEQSVLPPGHEARTGPAWLRGYARLRHDAIYRSLRNHRRAVGSAWRMALAAALRPGDKFLDVGGNVGRIAHSAAWLVGATGAVHTFEPSPQISQVLRRRVAYFALDNVTVNELALGAAAGQATLHEYEAGLGGSSSLRAGSSPGENHDRETAVSVQTLDGYVAATAVTNVRMLKVDVEGAELDVLRGAQGLLESQRPALLVEAARDTCAAFGHTLDDLIEAIHAAGYEIHSWRNPRLVRVETGADVPADRHHDDFLALAPERHSDIRDFFERAARIAT